MVAIFSSKSQQDSEQVSANVELQSCEVGGVAGSGSDFPQNLKVFGFKLQIVFSGFASLSHWQCM